MTSVVLYSKDETRVFSPMGGPLCPHKKKKTRVCGIFADGGAKVPTQEKKKKHVSVVETRVRYLPDGEVNLITKDYTVS